MNYATEKAAASLPPSLTVADAVATIDAAGCGARPVAAREGRERDEERLGLRLTVSAVLALPVVLLSMVPVVQFPFWQWVALAFALPVAVWGAWSFPPTMAGLLNPLVAGGAMAGSSVFMVSNSLRLRSFAPTPAPQGAPTHPPTPVQSARALSDRVSETSRCARVLTRAWRSEAESGTAQLPSAVPIRIGRACPGAHGEATR